MLRNRKRRQRAAVALIVVVSTLLGAYLTEKRFFNDNIQAAVYDYVITSAPAKVRNQVTVVALDDATVKRYGRWPVPRQAYVDLLNALRPVGARSIAFDVAFYDASDKPDQDKALAAAIKDSGNVYLAMQGSGSGEFRDQAEHFAAVLLPLDMFKDAAAGLGVVNVNPEFDSRVREAQLVVKGPNGATYYALALMAAAKQVSGDMAKARIVGGELVVPARPFDRHMPINEGGAMRVYFAAPPHPDVVAGARPCTDPDIFCVVSMVDVIDGKLPKELLQFRTVFVGAHTISAVPDNYPVPNSADQKMWGVEIWANVAQSIFTNRYPLPDQGSTATFIQMVALTVLGVLLVFRLRLIGLVLGILGLAVYSFIQLALFLMAVDPAFGDGAVAIPSIAYYTPAILWMVITLGYTQIEEQLAVTRTQSTFGRFVTPVIARTIMEREEKGALQLGGEMKEVTVLFGDIRGFTTISEGMDPPTLMGTLNRYFDGMVGIVNRYDGTVNKFNGDNIMVIWNAPVELPGHPRKAVECALEIQKWIIGERAKGGVDVAFGFGINTGPAVAGFLGASGRMEYTVIGDTVNVASRLTSGDIARRDQVTCTKETRSRLGDDVIAVDLGAIFVKGKSEPVECFQIDRIGLIANPNPAPPPEVPIGKAAVAGYH